jgi:hypothetical protein
MNESLLVTVSQIAAWFYAAMVIALVVAMIYAAIRKRVMPAAAFPAIPKVLRQFLEYVADVSPSVRPR